MQQQNFIDQIKGQFKHGGASVRLMFVSISVFLVLGVLGLISHLFELNLGYEKTVSYLISPGRFNHYIEQPWGIITHLFAHADIFHLLFNMLMLFFAGKQLESVIGKKRIYFLYFAAGLFGLLIHTAAHHIFPIYKNDLGLVLGASGAISGIFLALVFYRPEMETRLLGLIPVKMMYLGIGYIVFELLRIEGNDQTAHFAHLGGALFGYLYITAYKKGNDWSRFTEGIANWFKGLFKPKSRLKVKYSKEKYTGPKSSGSRAKDDAFNNQKAERQQNIDAILDKISKSGYESLSKKEKEYLFRESNR